MHAGNKQANPLANETVVHTYTKHTNQSAVTRTDTLAERCGSCTKKASWYGMWQAASVLPVATVRTPDLDGGYIHPAPSRDIVSVYPWWTVGTCPPERNKQTR